MAKRLQQVNPHNRRAWRGVLELAEGLIGGDADRGGEVEGTQLVAAELREGEAIGEADLLVQPVGTAMSLVSEEQAVAFLEAGGPVGPLGVGGEEPEPAGNGAAFPEGFPGIMDPEVKVLPVIHPAASQVTVLKGKPEGPDEVKHGTGEGAEAAGIASVLWDFRLEKDDMQIGQGAYR